MSDDKATPGKVHVETSAFLVSEDGVTVVADFELGSGQHETADANGQRLALSWNCCRALPVAALERLDVGELVGAARTLAEDSRWIGTLAFDDALAELRAVLARLDAQEDRT